MVQVARANGNGVEIYAQHVVDTGEVEIVPLTNEEREELERAMEESLRSMAKGGLTTEDEPVNIMELDILSAEERNVVDYLVASVQNRVYNQEENVEGTQGMDEMACDNQGNEEDNVGDIQEENVGAAQGSEEVNVVDNEGGNITPETQPEDTLTQENVTQQTQIDVSNVGKKGSRKGKEKQNLPPKRKRPVRRGSRTGITINDDDPPFISDSSSDDSDFEADYMVGHMDSFSEVGNGSKSNVQVSKPNEEPCSDNDNDNYVSEELKCPISSDDENDRIVYPQFNENAGFGEVTLELGMEFSTLKKLKDAVKDYIIHLGKQIRWLKNDKTRARAICEHDTCE